MRECPNGCDLEEFGGTHQGLPDCDLEPSNPDHRGTREGRKDDLLRDASFLLERGTSNSLIASDRQRWNIERDSLVEKIRVELLQ